MSPPPPDGTQLFNADELGAWIGKTVSETRALMVERVVWGWLKGPLGAETRPGPVPEEVFSWAVELGGIAHENPAGLSSKQLGSSGQAFSLERRNEILEAAAAGGSGSGIGLSQGCFPEAEPYPDPAR